MRIVHRITKTDQNTSTLALMAELGWETVQERERLRLGVFRAVHFNGAATNIEIFQNPHNIAVYSRIHPLQH